MTLFDIQQGEKCVITKVKGRGAFRKRIMEMGFVVGKEIIVGKKAPLKNPIEYTVMDYEVSLRTSEAKLIEVIPYSDYLRIKQHPKPRHHHYRERHRFENQNNLEESKFSRNCISDDTEKQFGKRRHLRQKSKTINVALVGNPNSGKTTLFNYSSHSKEKVGNYAGVTVDAKEAKFKQHGYTFNIVDLPGTYSITSYTPEEVYVRNYIFSEVPDVVVNIVDSSNLERNLYLTTQLIDLDIKVVNPYNYFKLFKDIYAPSAIYDNELNKNVTCFLNEGSSTLSVKSEYKINKIEVFSVNGMLVKSAISDFDSVSVSGLENNNMYLVKIFLDKGVAVKKIIKK